MTFRAYAGVGRWIGVLAATAFLAASCAGSAGPAASAGQLVAIGEGLMGPPGLKASVYAQGLPKVSAFAFDPEGRFWVATADYTYHGDDGLYVVTKAGAAPVEVVAGLRTPLGLLWYDNWLYVTSTGRVDAYSDFDGTRFAEHRTILTLPVGVGENNEIILGPDGRMLMGISAPCDHCVPTSTWSASIVSFRPDGSDLQVDASGIRAPFGLAYYPHTTDLFVTMNQRDDLGPKTPGDWLAVARQGQAWGFPNCYGQASTACRGVPPPTAVLDKHGAVSGVAIVTGQLGPTVGTSALVAEWAVGKVQRVALKKVGSAYKASVAPFLTGLHNPVPVLLRHDGTLFVGDWATGIVYTITAT